MSFFALPSLSKYPIDAAWQVKQASEYFSQNNNYFSTEEVLEFSKNLYNRAKALHIESDLDANLVKTAQLDVSAYNPDLIYFLKNRFTKIASEELAGEVSEDPYKELFEKKANVSPYVFAKAVEKLDKDLNADQYWGSTLSRPHEIVFKSLLEKKSHLDFLSEKDPDQVKAVVGDEAYSALLDPSEREAVWNTFPTPVKEALENI